MCARVPSLMVSAQQHRVMRHLHPIRSSPVPVRTWLGLGTMASSKPLPDSWGRTTSQAQPEPNTPAPVARSESSSAVALPHLAAMAAC